MAMIERMRIEGIRSYPPNAGSVIEFQTPLTLIVGLNGTGKTSIIESLKYITTGNLPPGCKLQAFVHDPKIAGEKEVKGQIKLQFIDTLGNKIICTRTSVSTQKMKKIETKSLDGVILKITPSGEQKSISSRCTDLSKEIVSRLGVPKAVIDNVIFCHQEDSNWPLSEGKELKKKFDEIFAATRYIKALESIRTLRKDQGQQVKLYNNDLEHLTQKKEKAQEIKSELQSSLGKLQSLKDKIQRITQAMTPLETQLDELNSVSEDVFLREKKLGSLTTEREQLNKNVESLQRNINDLFEGDYNALKKIQGQFKDEVETKKNDLQDLQTKVDRVNMALTADYESRTKLNKENGRLRQEADHHELLLKERDRLITKIASEFSFLGFDSANYDQSKADDFLQKMKDLFQLTVSEGKKARESIHGEVECVEKNIKDSEKELNSISGAIDEKNSIISTNNTKIKGINGKLSSLNTSANRLTIVQRQLERCRNDLEVYKAGFNSSQNNEELKTMNEEKKEEERKLALLKEEETTMLQHCKVQNNIESHERRLALKKDSIENLLERNHDKLEAAFGSDEIPSEQRLKQRLSQYIDGKQTEVKKQTAEHNDMCQKIAAFESKQKLLQKQLNDKQNELLSKEKEVYEVCKGTDYATYKDSIQQKVEKVGNALIEIGAFEKIYQKYVSQLQEQREKGCPLCHRCFKNDKESNELVNELIAKLKAVPEKRKSNEKSHKNDSELYRKLEQLAPTKSVLDSLVLEIPKLKDELKCLDRQIALLKTKLSEVEEGKAFVEDEERSGRSIEADVSKIDDYINELKDIERELLVERSKLDGVTPGQTLQSVRNAVADSEDAVDRLARRIESKKDQFYQHQKELGNREREANNLKEQELRLQEQFQQRKSMEGQMKELKTTNQLYERDVRSAADQLAPIRADLARLYEQKKETQSTKERNEEDTRVRLDRIKNEGNKVKAIMGNINSYLSEKKDLALEDNQRKLMNIEAKLKKSEEEKERKGLTIVRITEEISRHDSRAREIEDNLTLLNTNDNIRQIDEQVATIRAELSRYGDYGKFSAQKDDLQAKLETYRTKRAETEAAKRGCESEINKCERDLASNMYADAESKHCDKLIEIKTTELANTDLDKYYKALDSAIMRYHGLKLEEINKIVKEYWVKTYRGNDIDTIEIIADEEEGSGAAKSRRTYNYRVCMVKGNTNLDMRSRCSAGQKVLASLIIRLALAETFCLNCGILALDEPTTNLDEENIDSLANSLKDIIELRQAQKNFQLLVITHDEGFVQALGRSDYVENYFRVYKDKDGNSKIHKQRMEVRD